MTRRGLREHCFKMLFSADFYPTHEEAIAQLEQYFQSPDEDEVDQSGVLQVLHKVELKPADSEYLQARTAMIMKKIPEIDEKLNQAAAGWKTKRMGKVELTILRLAIFEMLFDDTIPTKVSINEAVELAKKFGGKDSPAFVNGVLAKFIPEEEKESRGSQEKAAEQISAETVEQTPAEAVGQLPADAAGQAMVQKPSVPAEQSSGQETERFPAQASGQAQEQE